MSDVPRQRRWYWPPRPFAFAISGCAAVAAFVVCFPAWNVPSVDVEAEGENGPYLGVVSTFEHGWPMCYARRNTSESHNDWIKQPDGTLAFDWQSALKPWHAPLQWAPLGLILDVTFWLLAVLLAGITAQHWRSTRSAVWQLGIRDLLALTAFVGFTCAWLVRERRDCLRERALAVESRFMEKDNDVYAEHYHASATPAWLPEVAFERWNDWFGRARYAESHGNSQVACQLKGLLTLVEDSPVPEFPLHLSHMPQLEGLDLGRAFLRFVDKTETKTILSQCPPMPNLRGINLVETDVKDVDLVWLANCPRLERIELSRTQVGNQGLEHLSRLRALRVLTVWDCDFSDEGCRSLAKLHSLEGLGVSSPQIHAAGVEALGGLKNLRRLSIKASASPADFEALKRRLPQCEIDYDSY